MRGLSIHPASENKVHYMISVHLIPTSCNGHNRFAKVRNGYIFTIQMGIDFWYIVDLQSIRIDNLTVQKKINISIISIFDKLKNKNHSSKRHEVDVSTLNLLETKPWIGL